VPPQLSRGGTPLRTQGHNLEKRLNPEA
jgi:hypothetical protein